MTNEEWEAIKPYAEAAETALSELRDWEMQKPRLTTRGRLESAVERERLQRNLDIKGIELAAKMRELEIYLN